MTQDGKDRLLRSGDGSELRALMGVTALPHHRNYLRHLAVEDGSRAGTTRRIETLCGRLLYAIRAPSDRDRRECERCARIADRNRLGVPS